jgi:hypothetical protein
MRADEFIKEEEQLDEVLPLVGLAAKAAGGMLAKGAAKAAGGMLARGVGKAVGAVGNKVAGAIGSDEEEVANPAVDQAKDQMIKPGIKLPLATTATGGPEQFKVTRVQGDEVEIENPKPQGAEPQKVVYKRDDLKKSMSL